VKRIIVRVEPDKLQEESQHWFNSLIRSGDSGFFLYEGLQLVAMVWSPRAMVSVYLVDSDKLAGVVVATWEREPR
jgi:hypothetical protein